MGQAVATLADSKVHPSIMVQTCEVIFVDELVWDVQDFNANIFRLRHGCVKVEVLKVNRANACNFLREYTVEEELEQFQRRCVSIHIARVADVVANNGDSCAVRVVLVWTDFTYNHGMAYFLSLVWQDVVVVDAKERVGTGNTLRVGGLASSSLAYKVSHVVLYPGSRWSWQCSSILPVVGSRTDRANGLSSCKRAEQRAAKWVVSAVIM